MEYPTELIDQGRFDRALARFNEATEARARAQAAVTDAIGGLRNAQAERDALVLRSSKEGGVSPSESIAAHQCVRDAEAYVVFLREALTAAEAEVVEAQLALNKASGESHRPVLEHMIDQRIAAAAELDRTLLATAEAQARYNDTTDVITQAMQRGARHPGGPHLSRGPYGKHPGQHEAAERAAWGLPPKGTRLS